MPASARQEGFKVQGLGVICLGMMGKDGGFSSYAQSSRSDSFHHKLSWNRVTTFFVQRSNFGRPFLPPS